MSTNPEINKLGIEQLNPDLSILVNMGLIFSRCTETDIRTFSGNYLTSKYEVDGCGIELVEGVKLLIYVETANTADSVTIRFKGAYNNYSEAPIKLGLNADSANVGIGALHGTHILLYINGIWSVIASGSNNMNTNTSTQSLGGLLYRATSIDRNRCITDLQSQFGSALVFQTPTTADLNLLQTADESTIIGPLLIPIVEMPLGKYSISLRVKVNNQLGGDVKLCKFVVTAKMSGGTDNVLTSAYIYKSDFSYINDFDVFGTDFDLRGIKDDIIGIEFKLLPCYSNVNESTQISLDYLEIFKTFASMTSLSRS